MAKATSRKAQPTPAKRVVFNLKVCLDTAGAARHMKRFRRSETIYSQGDPAKNVKFIQASGEKLSVINEDGKEAVMAMLGPGDFLARRA